jgi:outer membrane lipoprotein-sorting protein
MNYFLSLVFAAFITFNNVFAYDITNLIADANARYGGIYAEMTDMTIKQQATVKDDAAETIMSMTMHRKGDKWRNEAQIGDGAESMNMTTLFDGTDYWSVMMGMKTKLPKGEMDSKGMAEDYWKDIPDSAKMVGEETLNGRDCWIVEWNEDQEPMRTWIAKDDLMHVQTITQSGGKTTKIINSDFRKVHKDFMIPYVTEVYSGDKLIMTSIIREFTSNTGLADELFDPEKLGGSEMNMQNLDLEKMMKQAEEMQKKQGEGK